MRILQDDEIRRLLAASETHSLVYAVILLTGLRRSELAGSGQSATIPLHVSLLKGLRALALEPHAPTDPVFGPMPSSNEMRSDLSAAGVVLVDRAGRQAEIHSLRHTYYANIHRSAVFPEPYWNVTGKPSLRPPELGLSTENIPFAPSPAARGAEEIRPPNRPAGSGQKISGRRAASAVSSRSLTMLLLYAVRTSRVTMLILGVLIIGMALGLGWFLGSVYKPPGLTPLTRELTPDSTPDGPHP
jgi:hypothetical protein